MKTFKVLERTDECQADCFWHDHGAALRYLLVLPGAMKPSMSEPIAEGISQRAGLVSHPSPEYHYVSNTDPNALPGENGPVTVMLIL